METSSAPADVPSLLRDAEAELARGDAFAQEEQWDEARRAFDRAVDLLLSAPGGIESHPGLALAYHRALEEIHQLERTRLAANESAEEPASESLSVEDLSRAVDLANIDPNSVADAPTAGEVFDLPVDRGYRLNPVSIFEFAPAMLYFIKSQKRLPSFREYKALRWGRWDLRAVLDPAMFPVWSEFSKFEAIKNGLVKRP